MKRMILIDGNAMVHRAFHAYPPNFTTPDGRPSNAVYGFFAMFLKILEEVKPQYAVVCFDRPKPTFRQELYVGYHAHRPALADGLVPQIGMIHDVLDGMGVQIFEVDGYEADDLIGTISKKATEDEDKEVYIVSGDRDLLQLVNSRVKMLAPLVGITKMILYDEHLVEQKFGIKPSQVIDYKALVGDQSDGYPGVAGIGPKTAADLIRKYHTHENLYLHLQELPPKTAEKLATDAEQSALAKKLATIITNAPIQFDIEKCATLHLDIEKTKEKFAEYGFNSLLARLPFVGNGEEVVKVEGESRKTIKKKKTSNVGDQLGLLDS